MSSHVHCFCGQSFTIPEERPWTFSCQACGRKLCVVSGDKVEELARPKEEPETGRAEVKPIRAPAKPELTCMICGAELRGPCAWCGQNHCWLHAPKGHPSALSGTVGPELGWQPWGLVLIPFLLIIAGILLGILLNR